ncbi:MAG: VOC family protein [Bacteroidota bacterium]
MNKIFSYVAIPCTDFPRAYQFYHDITDGLIQKNPNVPFPMAYFVDKDYNYVGHLFQLNEMKVSPEGPPISFKPSGDGVIVYMEMAKDLNETMEKIEKAGGKVVMAKTLIAPGKGYWALFLDTEGNRIALHSEN